MEYDDLNYKGNVKLIDDVKGYIDAHDKCQSMYGFSVASISKTSYGYMCFEYLRDAKLFKKKMNECKHILKYKRNSELERLVQKNVIYNNIF